jgi:DNA-binding helix-hairpin-helix protein with protein kinase domain
MTGAATERVVYDERGGELRLVRSLGRGGQGEVWASSDGKRAVKVLSDSSPARQEQLAHQLRRVRRLPLDGLPIARPQLLLAPPVVGYVMTLAEGMTSLRNLMFPLSRRDIVGWYMEGGGLRRRLTLLAHVAEVLAQLHGRAIAHGDPSPNNVLVSEDVGHAEIFLIDTDNLAVTSQPDQAVYTPFYGAPEVVRRESGASTLTDAHGFAVLTFETLSLTHPLIGDAVAAGEPELEAAALAGDLPWVDDQSSDENRCSTGFPRDLVLTRRLRELCAATFGGGLRKPIQRPGLAAWAEQLRHAEDITVRCKSCESTYYGTSPECVWCGKRRGPLAVFEILLAHGGMPEHPSPPARIGAVFLSSGDPRPLTQRLATGRTGDNEVVLEATLQASDVLVKNVSRAALTVLGHRTSHELSPGKEARIPLKSADVRLVFGDPDNVHRFAVVRGVESAG